MEVWSRYHGCQVFAGFVPRIKAVFLWKAPVGAFFCFQIMLKKLKRTCFIYLTFWMCVGIILPNHNYPWLSFHQELAVAIGVVPLGLLCFFEKKSINFEIAVLYLVCVLLVIMQQITGMLAYQGDMWLMLVYMAILVMALHVGECLQSAKDYFLRYFSTALIIAGVLNFGVCAHQKLSLNRLDVWVVNAPETARAIGNLAQSNHVAVFFVLGIFSAVWLSANSVISFATLILVVLVLSLGVVWTASKTALVIMLWFFVFMLYKNRVEKISKKMFFRGLLALIFGAVVSIFWWYAKDYLELPQDGQSAVGRMLSGDGNSIRIVYWVSMLDAIARNPIFGYGALQIGVAQWETVLEYPSTETFFNSSHMLPLDLALWFGVPIASLLFYGVCKKIWRAVIDSNHDDVVYVILVVVAIFVHAMLEYPHQYLYFIIPFGIMLGIVGDRNSKRLSIGEGVIDLVSLTAKSLIFVSLVIGVGIVCDYFDFEKKWERLRFLEADFVVEKSPDDQRSDIFLTNLGALYQELYLQEVMLMPDAERLLALEKLAVRYPLTANLRRYAVALALAGRYEESGKVILRLRKMHSLDICESNEKWWNIVGLKEYPALRNVKYSCAIN